MIDVEKQVLRVLDIYKTAVLAKNAEALMRIYDPKVRVFDAWGVWSHEGADAWRIAVDGWFASLGSESVRVSFEDIHIFGEQELASMTAVATYEGVSAQSEPLRSMQNRMSWVLRFRGHVLRVVHEHTSMPVGFADAKAILRREPKR